MMRRLEPGDFLALWKLASPYIDRRLKPDMESARKCYNYILSQATNCSMGEFDEAGNLVGAVMVSGCQNAYAKKGFAKMEMWLGSIALLDQAIKWWDGRPGLRFLVLEFPCNVRSGLYKLLARRGFEKNGDMNFLWRESMEALP